MLWWKTRGPPVPSRHPRVELSPPACRGPAGHMRWLLRLVEAAGKEGASEEAASIRSHRYTKGEEETDPRPPGPPRGAGRDE